jgi:hypothetical protein
MPIKTRPRLIAAASSTTKLFVDDGREIAALAQSENKTRSDVIRELVHEALRQRRLRALGRDEGEAYLRRLHQEALQAGLTPVLTELAALRALATPTPTAAADVTAAPERARAARQGTASLQLLAALLQKLTLAEHLLKVLVTVGMQKDGLGADEIKRQLAGHELTGLEQTQAMLQRVLGEGAQALLNGED